MTQGEKIERKRDVLRILKETRSVRETARRLGLDRRTVQRILRRMGLSVEDVLQPVAESVSKPMSAPAPHVAKPDPEPAAPPAKPERDPRRLSISDFSGPNLGEAVAPESNSGSVDALLGRYRKLRDS